MLQIIATVVAIVAIPLLALIWFLAPSYKSDEPAPVPYAIPWLGNALGFTNYHRVFMDASSSSVNGKPFSILVAGRKHYVFSNLADFATVHKTRTLDIRNFIKMLQANLFGMTKQDADRVLEIKPVVHELHTKYLLTSKYNSIEAARYFVDLDAVFNVLDEKIKDSETGTFIKDGFVFVADTQGNATVTSYFGQSLLDLYPDLLSDFTAFVKEGFWPLLGGAPNFLFPRPVTLRERGVQKTREWIELVRKDESLSAPFMAARLQLLKEQNFGEDATARDIYGMIFAVNGNSIPTAYLILLYILDCPGLVGEIRQELQDAGYASLAPADYVPLFPLGLPLLRSAFWEGIRMTSVTNGIREVLEPTELVTSDRTFKLQKGCVVTLPSCLVHMNPDLHPEPYVFKPRRFLDKQLGGDGENHMKTLKPFGGGTSYCPGRVFAEKQVMAFLAEMCWRYEMRVVNKEGFKMPDNADFHYVAKCPSAVLELKLRDLV